MVCSGLLNQEYLWIHVLKTSVCVWFTLSQEQNQAIMICDMAWMNIEQACKPDSKLLLFETMTHRLTDGSEV